MFSEEYLKAVELELAAAQREGLTGIYSGLVLRRVPVLIQLLRAQHAELVEWRQRALTAEAKRAGTYQPEGNETGG